MAGAARPMVVAGVMSGTSADGVDVAVCRISTRAGRPMMRLLGHTAVPYTRAVREAVLRAMDADAISVAEMSRLNWRLGALYADAVERAAAEAGVALNLVGCHGQTVYHQPLAQRSFGAATRCTWQTGEAAVIAERLRCPVVSDFRPADLAAGGQGAPLVPMLDSVLFGSARQDRVLLNLGGIANVTALPAGAEATDVIAFDTGPANMVVDGCMRRLFGREYDRGGGVARQGVVRQSVVEQVLRDPYFAQAPPKSCGREQFGDRFCDALVRRCQKLRVDDADVVATATEVTVRSVVEAYTRSVRADLQGRGQVEWIAAGGGTRNEWLMARLAEELRLVGATLGTTDRFGVPAEAKEAMAFALLAWLTWHRRPGNVPAATGAARPVVLGKVCFG